MDQFTFHLFIENQKKSAISLTVADRAISAFFGNFSLYMNYIKYLKFQKIQNFWKFSKNYKISQIFKKILNFKNSSNSLAIRANAILIYIMSQPLTTAGYIICWFFFMLEKCHQQRIVKSAPMMCMSRNIMHKNLIHRCPSHNTQTNWTFVNVRGDRNLQDLFLFYFCCKSWISNEIISAT